jgi:hypothetical protein
MEEWVLRALKRWPNVPALFGWLKLDRRGRWLIKGETIGRPQIIDVINRNYAADEYGRWYFQNGPQRGYMQLEYAPLILHSVASALITHTGLPVESPTGAFMDEEGALTIKTEHGAGLLLDSDLDWALHRMSVATKPINAEQLADALAIPSGSATEIILHLDAGKLSISRLNAALVPAHLNFVRDPQLRASERNPANIPA